LGLVFPGLNIVITCSVLSWVCYPVRLFIPILQGGMVQWNRIGLIPVDR